NVQTWRSKMTASATNPYLVTFRFTGEELSTIFKLNDQLMTEHLELVSIQQESEDDPYIEDDLEDEVFLKAIDGDHVVSSVVAQIDQFIADPPDTNYKLGKLAALVSLYREGLDHNLLQANARIHAAEQLIAHTFVTETPGP